MADVSEGGGGVMEMSIKNVKRLLIGLMMLFLVYDIYWVFSPDYDINKHAPFLNPVCLVIVLAIIKQIEGCEPAKGSEGKTKNDTEL